MIDLLFTVKFDFFLLDAVQSTVDAVQKTINSDALLKQTEQFGKGLYSFYSQF